MSKKKNHKLDDLRKLPENSKRKPISKESRKLFLYTMINLVVLMSIYFYFVKIEVIAVMFVYMALTLVLSVAFVIYNRGFAKKDVTPEMLPSEWSEEKKREFIDDGKTRLQKSRWMITVILPLFVTLCADFIIIQTIPYFRDIFNI